MGVVTTFTRRRQNTIAGDIAGVIRLAFEAGHIASMLGLEGILRASLRADLCLRGWQWIDADRAAIDIVASAHRLLGAERPDWYEGQREWTVEAGTLIERTRCARCHKKLPEGNFKYCSRLCNTGHANRRHALRTVADGKAADMAIRML